MSEQEIKELLLRVRSRPTFGIGSYRDVTLDSQALANIVEELLKENERLREAVEKNE